MRINRAKDKELDPFVEAEARKSWLSWTRKAFWTGNFLFATFILSMQGWHLYPRGEGDVGYVWLWSLTPSQYTVQPHFYRFWPAVGAVYLVFVIDNAVFLQSMFTSRLSAYLGRISFSMYLVHGPLLAIWAHPFMDRCFKLTGQDTNFQYGLGFALGTLVVFPAIVWVADIVTRLVDENCVTFVRWLYEKSLESPNKWGLRSPYKV